ncbi:MAG: hypothetical protein Q9201_002815 [Fulgogasparrea decipioides]
MSLFSPSRSHHAFVLFLWLSMLFLLWQHYHGLNHMPTRPIGKDVTAAVSQTELSSSAPQPEDNTSLDTISTFSSQRPKQPLPPAAINGIDALLSSIAKTSLYFVNGVLPPSEFNQMGARLQIISTWLEARETLHPKLSKRQIESLDSHIERAVMSLFPFIRNPAQPKNTQPFSTLRQTFKNDTKGIVLVANKINLRYVCHLIKNIRTVLNSTLPIQVAHAGDDGLGPSRRRFLTRLGSNITTIDITQMVDNKPLDLENGGPAIRSFAALASTFEQVILVGSTSVFLQRPETIFDTCSVYKSTGALLFHNHLYGKGDNRDSHDFWLKQLKNHDPSPSLKASRVYNEGYSEEADGGVIVLDKSRLSTLVGLLHVCWQNTKMVRKGCTYAFGQGDKNSWWLGFELSGSPYTWEKRYGGTIGSIEEQDQGMGNGENKKASKHERVCGNTILHLDENDQPLWFSGTLLKDRKNTDKGFLEADKWMVDGVFQERGLERGMDCMWGDKVRELDAKGKEVIEESIRQAREVDEGSTRFVAANIN